MDLLDPDFIGNKHSTCMNFVLHSVLLKLFVFVILAFRVLSFPILKNVLFYRIISETLKTFAEITLTYLAYSCEQEKFFIMKTFI